MQATLQLASSVPDQPPHYLASQNLAILPHLALPQLYGPQTHPLAAYQPGYSPPAQALQAASIAQQNYLALPQASGFGSGQVPASDGDSAVPMDIDPFPLTVPSTHGSSSGQAALVAPTGFTLGSAAPQPGGVSLTGSLSVQTTPAMRPGDSGHSVQHAGAASGATTPAGTAQQAQRAGTAFGCTSMYIAPPVAGVLGTVSAAATAMPPPPLRIISRLGQRAGGGRFRLFRRPSSDAEGGGERGLDPTGCVPATAAGADSR